MTSKVFRNEPSAHFEELIQLLDDDKRGFITVQSLRRAMEGLNIEASE
jgi:Ca2+-binding EF-hand superfamily protein